MTPRSTRSSDHRSVSTTFGKSSNNNPTNDGRSGPMINNDVDHETGSALTCGTCYRGSLKAHVQNVMIGMAVNIARLDTRYASAETPAP
jgi:hypothetical protein